MHRSRAYVRVLRIASRMWNPFESLLHESRTAEQPLGLGHRRSWQGKSERVPTRGKQVALCSNLAPTFSDRSPARSPPRSPIPCSPFVETTLQDRQRVPGDAPVPCWMSTQQAAPKPSLTGVRIKARKGAVKAQAKHEPAGEHPRPP